MLFKEQKELVTAILSIFTVELDVVDQTLVCRQKHKFLINIHNNK